MHNDNKKSKFLNNPVRTIVIEDDNRPGSYPVHIPPGSTLVDPIYFDDTDTIETPTDRSFANSDTFKVSSQVDQLNEVEILFTNASLFEQHRIKFSDKTTGNISGEGTIIGGTRTYFISKPSDIFRGDSLTTTQFATRTNEAIVAKINDIGLLTANIDSAGFIKVTCRSPGVVGNSTQIDVQSPYFTNFSVAFSGGAGGTYRLPFGIPSAYLDAGSEVALRAVASSSYLDLGIDVFGPGDSRLLEVYSKGHPVYKGPNSIAPYNETNAIQSFGLGSRPNNSGYGTDPSQNSEFFLRGSTSGSLDESLANKDKIVIDLEPVEKTTIQWDAEKTDRDNFPMMYFNHELKKWEPIGLNEPLDLSVADLNDELDRTMIGFGQSYSNEYFPAAFSELEIYAERLQNSYTGEKAIFREPVWANPIDTFGFPKHPKFAATGSQVLEIESIVDRPFLVEKIVYEFSGSMSTLWRSTAGNLNRIDTSPLGGTYELGTSTFFILNQRKANTRQKNITNYLAEFGGIYKAPGFRSQPSDQEEVIYTIDGPPADRQLSVGGPSVYVDSTRELLTYSRVGTVTSDYDDRLATAIEPGFPHPADFMDLAIDIGPSSATGPQIEFFSGKFTLSDSVKNSGYYPALSSYLTFSPSLQLYLSNNNSQDNPTGRGYRAEFGAQDLAYSCLPRNALAPSKVYAPIEDSFVSPYLIRPGDRLVFGWQSGMTSEYRVQGPDFTIAPGAGKLTLYGSYLRDNKPVHDIYKDQLSSDAAHEAIPAGPWVLDRFEAEPSMVYTGSMRAQLVTGTMVTQGSGGSLSVTDRDDLSLGGVRVVAATSYDGNLGQRGSFYRNLRLVDSEEQYYDSMQPNTLDTLSVLSNGNELRLLEDGGATDFAIMVRLPGESYTSNLGAAYNTFINDYSNDTFIGSYPFEPKFSEIAREKRVSVKNINDRFFESLAAGLARPTRIAFVTGTVGGSRGNMERAGGLFKTSEDVLIGLAFPVANPNDTNPVSAVGAPAGAPGNYILSTEQIYGGNIPYLSLDYHFSRLMGCFGDGYLGLVQYSNYSLFYPNEQIYRGARYGLVNPTPLFSTAIYNGTSFGQPRDLMEPRKYSRFSLADNTLTDSAVDVVFVDNTVIELADGARNNVTSGSATNSINISPFCTSSLPFVDGQVNDRSLPLPEDLLRL